MHHTFVWDGLCMARAEMCAGFQEILYFINITCRNYQLGAAVGLGPVVMGLITFWLSLGLKSQKSVVHSAGGTLHLSTLMSAATLCSVPVVPSPCWPWDNNIKQGMHWLLLLFFFPHLSPSFLTAMAVSSLGGSIRLTNWEFQPPLFQPPLEHACWLCCGALNPGIPPDPQPQGPRAHRDSLSRGLPQGEEPRSSGMKQNVSDVMNWTSVSSEGKKKEKFISSNERCKDILVCW